MLFEGCQSVYVLSVVVRIAVGLLGLVAAFAGGLDDELVFDDIIHVVLASCHR